MKHNVGMSWIGHPGLRRLGTHEFRGKSQQLVAKVIDVYLIETQLYEDEYRTR